MKRYPEDRTKEAKGGLNSKPHRNRGGQTGGGHVGQERARSSSMYLPHEAEGSAWFPELRWLQQLGKPRDLESTQLKESPGLVKKLRQRFVCNIYCFVWSVRFGALCD